MRTLGIILGVCFSMLASAHHSTVAIFDGNTLIDVTGVVKSVSWRNPHGRIVLEIEDGGELTDWRVEMASIGVLRNSGVDIASVEVGDIISVAGSPSRRNRPEIFARNLLLSTGEEYTFLNSEVYFQAGKSGNIANTEFSTAVIEEARANADGLFRVWSTIMSDPAAFPMFKGGYPLSEAAEAVVEQWDPLDNDLLDCGQKGMPLIMISPLPMEFTRSGDEIILSIEEYDVRRVIHMAPDALAPENEFTQFGFSKGHWQGETLVVETSHMREQDFDPDGVPQSTDMVTVERFIPNEAYDRLNYTINVTDPQYFTESFELTRYFVWLPAMSVKPYECLDRDYSGVEGG